MAEPVVFISHFRIREGGLEPLTTMARSVIEHIRTDKPRTEVYLSYADEDGSRIHFLHAFADSEALDVHVEGAAERARAAATHMEPLGWEIYGVASDRVIGEMQAAAEASGVEVRIHRQFVGGFMRTRSG